MATYTYNLTTGGNTGTITITTDDTLRTYQPGGVGATYTGYAITGVSGTFNGQTITGILPSNNLSSNPLTNDGAGNGNVGQYDNVLWSSDTQGNSGQSFYGLDNRGLAFTAGGQDYKIFKPSASTNTLVYNGNSQSSAPTTLNSTNAPCYVTGTLIRTARGDVAVEDLLVGDVAITRDGRRKPIRWIGHRHTHCDRHPEPRKVYPVRVAAGTFGDGLPYADLWLSPGHAVCLDNSLVPVRGLIDGARIAQVEQADVTYWHVELDGHDVLLANGLPAESYLDTGNRRGFENGGIANLHFDEDPAPGYDGSGYCLPMVESGPLLSLLRARFGLGGRVKAAAQSVSEVHLVADGAVLAPSLVGENELRVLIPAGTVELRLVSPSFAAPGDVRRLGVIVGSLAVSDGSSWQGIALDDAGLYAGFHEAERNENGAWRWTDGEGHLSSSLWAGLTGDVLLRVTGVFSGLAPAAEDSERIAA